MTVDLRELKAGDKVRLRSGGTYSNWELRTYDTGARDIYHPNIFRIRIQNWTCCDYTREGYCKSPREETVNDIIEIIKAEVEQPTQQMPAPQFEVGKLYRDFDGEKVMCLACDEASIKCYFYSTDSVAEYSVGFHRLEDFTPWVEQRKGKVWVNVYIGSDGEIYYDGFYISREAADKDAPHRRITCVCVPWTEGEGLEGGTE